MTMNDNLIPLFIIAVFIIIVVMIGELASMRIKNSDDYLIAGRNAPLFLIVGTLFATFWGGGTIIGGTGAAYEDGIFGVIEDPFAAGLSLIIIGLFFVTTLRNLKIKSIGELYNLRFGQTTGYFASALMIPTYVIWTAVQLLAISKVLNVFFDVNLTVTFLIATIVVVAFTYMGGLLAVVWTDTIQMFIIFGGLIAILVIGFKMAGGVKTVFDNTPPNFWNFLPRENNVFAWISYIAMWAGMGLGNIPSPDIAQRAFMSKDAKTAKKGMIIAGGLYWTIGFVPIIIALIGITLSSMGILDSETFKEDSELLIPYMAKALLGPVGLGFFASSLIAAILSSASTSLFATAVLFSNDIYTPLVKRYRKQRNIQKEIDDVSVLRVTKRFVLIVGLLAAGIGLISTNIYDLTIFAFTLQFGVLFFPFILALKSQRVTTKGIVFGMLTGLLINLVGCIINKSVIPEPWEFYTLVPALANLVCIVLVSHFTKKSPHQISLNEIKLR